jgi:hypothetical protein
MSMKNYNLDPLHYLTLPGLAWDACLKMTKVNLQLICDHEQMLFVEKALRGGISQISQRYAKANNPLVPDYDPTIESNYLIYLDCNNLYGFAMMESLPVGGFEFLNREDMAKFNLQSCDPHAETGYLLEVDLEYPAHLHDSHNCYPLAPEKYAVKKDDLSPYTLHLANKFKLKLTEQSKLIPNFNPKERYVTHYRNLQYYTTHGLVVTKIHRILKFDQKPWLSDYISFNTSQRKLATSEFAKSLYKLMNNAVYGRSLMNKRLQSKHVLVRSKKRALKWCSKPTFESFKIINENLVVLKMKQASITLDTPCYVGTCVLELSKLHMYQFHYDVIRAQYGDKARLLFTDTDSLVYDITTPDLYADILATGDRYYDTSDYPIDHALHSKKNAKTVGYFKDELNGTAIHEFVGLRAKMYSFKLPHEKSKSTAKGIKKSFLSKHIVHENYKKCLQTEETTSASFQSIRSFNHELVTYQNNKSALSPFDDKRYLLGVDGKALAYGHF